jgi:hypothetical protein
LDAFSLVCIAVFERKSVWPSKTWRSHRELVVKDRQTVICIGLEVHLDIVTCPISISWIGRSCLVDSRGCFFEFDTMPVNELETISS